MTASVAEITAGMSPEQREVAAAKIRARTARLRTIRECPTALDLMCRFTPDAVRTPALEEISARLREATSQHSGRLVVSMPPQEGKSWSLRWLCLWLLIDNPARRVAYASYAAFPARKSGHAVRGMIETYGDEFGLSLSRDRADQSDWQLDGHRGGMVSVGVGGALTGVPADVMIIDDSLRGRKDANSDTIRESLHEWWRTTSRTRLSAGAPVIVVGTRWHEDDLSGRLVDEFNWPLLNIPALSDGQTLDALNRPAGEWLISAQGRSVQDWETTRVETGEHGFASLYQGRPAPLEGGVFQASWFDTWRVHEQPPGCLSPVVVVDPADNEGDGDEAGIILATKHPASGKVFILDDLSAPMTVGRWARLALLTCVRRDAPTLAFEQSLSQLPKRLREAWETLHTQALALRHANHDLPTALARLSRPDDSLDALEQIELALLELTTDDVDGILSVGVAGPRLIKITAKGKKQDRMLWVAPQFETGRAALVGRFPQLEHQAAVWQQGMDSPDRVDALVHACQYLGGVAAVASLGRAEDRIPTNSTALRNRGSSRIGRSTRR